MRTHFTYKLSLDIYKVRQMCIDNHYYTRGNSEDYEKMLEYVSEHETITEADLFRIANDILKHSDRPDEISDDELDLVIWSLLNKCSRIDIIRQPTNAMLDEMKTRMIKQLDYYRGRAAWLYESEIAETRRQLESSLYGLCECNMITREELNQLREWLSKYYLEVAGTFDCNK